MDAPEHVSLEFVLSLSQQVPPGHRVCFPSSLSPMKAEGTLWGLPSPAATGMLHTRYTGALCMPGTYMLNKYYCVKKINAHCSLTSPFMSE